MAISQAYRDLAINTVLGEDKVLIVHASVSEQLGRMFQIDVELISEDPNLAFDTIVGTNTTIRVELPGSKTPRYFNGYVSRFVQTRADGDSGEYRATIVPWLWFLSRTADCRIFQTKSVPDMIKQIFRDHGFTDFKDSLTGNYTPWDNCVQYRETDYNFISRLMEHEGIYYFFEHENGKHTLVLADSASAHSPFEGYEKVGYNASRIGKAEEETIYDWTMEQAVQTGTYSLNDYNFETPRSSLVAQSNISTQNSQSTYSIYDYPGEFGTQSEGSDYAKLRIEEMHAQHEVLHGTSGARGLTVGYTFTMTNAARRDQNRKYLVTASTCHLTADNYTSAGSGSSQPLFSCSFSALDATKPFRAARVTPKPLIQGPQTAIVVGPSGEEIYTDKYARVKVQFHWDRYGKADENSSAWARVSQAGWAGKKWGAMYIPRVGQEVIVEFLEGDPDLPIVTGQVYNAENMPPYELPANKTRTTLKSNSSKGGGGFNELRFEDKKGSEQIFIHAEKQLDERVKADSFEWIGGERHLIVTKDQFELVKADKHQEVKGEHNTKVGENFSLTAGQNIQEKAGMNVGVEGGMEVHIKAGMKVVIEAGVQLTLKVGGNYIDINPAGVMITGTMVMINSGGAAGSGSGISPTAPKPAKEADDDKSGDVSDASATPATTRPTSVSPITVAMLQAAGTGAPFCEQCAKAAEEQAAEEDQAGEDQPANVQAPTGANGVPR